MVAEQSRGDGLNMAMDTSGELRVTETLELSLTWLACSSFSTSMSISIGISIGISILGTQ